MINRRQPRYSKGQRIADRFLIHQVLMGGMGEVYLCFDEEDLLPYALKTFQGSSPELADIFKREVASWIALEKHPNIVRCFWMEKFDNIPFMSLEWVAAEEGRGTDLRSWLQRGALDLPIALRFTIDIVRGLIHAGEKSPGIVHRDLKPDNVLVDGSCQAKITDFGLATVAQLARLVSDTTDEANLEQSRHIGGIVGTPAYMPPEQWRGEGDIDFRADVYAVGCMLYELLTGEWLYNARTISELRAQHLEALLPVLNHHFPAALKWVLEGCLAKRREERYARLDELLAELIKLHEAHSDEPLPEVKAQAFTASDYNNRGVTFNNLEQHRRAITDYDEAIRIDPTFAQAYYNRGNSYSALGQHERAITDYDEAIRLDPTLAQAYTNRGYSYAGLGQHERAIADHDEAIRLDPTLAQAYTNRGYSYGTLGQHERAIANFDEAIRLDPTYVQAYYNRGSIHSDLGQHERAIANFDEAIRLDPTLAQAWLNKGVVLADSGLLEEAISCFKRSAELGEPNGSLYEARVRKIVDQSAAFDAFQYAYSLDMMQQAVAEFPVLAQIIPTIEKIIARTLPPQYHPLFDQRLAWLRQVVKGK